MTLKTVEMPTIIRKATRLGLYVSVPGGWILQIPQVHCGNDALLDAYADYFRSMGIGSPLQAASAASATVQATYAHGYIDGLKEAIARRAHEYAAKWPELRKVISRRDGLAVVECLGFDPKRIQEMYVPFQHTGRAGQAFVATMLAEMANNAKVAIND